MYVRVNSQGKEGELHHREAREGSGEGKRGRGRGGGSIIPTEWEGEEAKLLSWSEWMAFV
jgi:hypothetical protein